ncbi:GNAT family N-acetyltransferase [Paenibacillus polymyxa]|uniref:Acetoin utilization protein acuA n=1 Tax=Paenibacillus polymyxa TaxID=1406 RepID=A0A0F0G307_PAEPO|nr:MULTISPECIES: GNAT family N-acetyltransferase [Paenibacillus]AHM66757.1 GNAT family acetyltransferase [Paenibacillus polymyxa SQR-21]AIY07660.1 acetoin utilization protein [Paenibacillus polymyxa]AUS27428.1 acetoin utilization protein [Paenibacillus polymyxa]KAE8559481.1 N-acetyltransferase [Paenibacillus polymyxa]KAF6584116.1 GNAT family N-acetyltransferase [Paenibacillus sp. EKM211P]
MQHLKLYHLDTLDHNGQTIHVEGPVSADRLRSFQMHTQLDAFRKPKEQFDALVEISELPEGRIIIAHDGETLLGYVTFHYPDEMERWSEAGMKDLLELGAVEVADDYRGLGLGSRMIRIAFEDGQLESYIIFTTEYYWHWDLKGSGLSVWEYRRMMERLMKTVNMVWYATDDPEICSHPANCLMVRMGDDVPLESREQFDRIRFVRRFMY